MVEKSNLEPTRPEIVKGFVVIEGLDGAGTSTQLAKLAERAEREGVSVHATYEPTEGAIGQYIRQVLRGEEYVVAETLAFLYAADRNEHLFHPSTGIVERAKRQWVFCDRYLFSSLAYQGMECDYSFVDGLNARFPLPEHLVFVDLSPWESEKRRLGRHAPEELYDKLDVQKRVYEQYRAILEQFRDSDMRIHFVDGRPDPETVSGHIWDAVFRYS
jgi:dTMP kinase